MTYLHGVGFNVRVLVFAAGVAALAGLVASLTPVVRWSVSDVHTGLSEGSRGSAGTAWRRVGSRLVVLELATATVLLCGAGLLGKSLYRLLHVEVGLRPDRLVTMQVAAPRSVYSSDEKVILLHRQILSRIASLPGVESAGTTSQLPISGNGNTTWFRVLGRPWHGEHNEVPERYVSPGYFTTLGATLVRGRYFTEEDGPSRPAVAIVNRTFERQYFPGEDPLVAKVAYLRDPPGPIAIVGVVEDIREGPLGVAIPAVLYVPSAQNPGSGFGLVVRTAQAEPSILRVVSNAIRDIDPGIVTAAPLTMEDRISNSPSASLHRSSAWLVGGFAALALLLGVVGLYGVIAYSVSQRTREIGVRMALGAERRSVYRLILQEAGWLTAVGLALGLAGSIAAAGTMRGLFFGIRSWDAATLTLAAVTLAAATLLASYVPARRAASVNPIEALRTE
jgi:predicted permease